MRQKVEATPRLSVSPARRKRVLEAHGGRCYYPGCEETKDLEFEHVIPLWMGGKDDDSNTAPMCGPHHKSKTATDAKMRAKVKRLIKRDTEPKEPSRMKSRPFEKSDKPHAWPKRSFPKRAKP